MNYVVIIICIITFVLVYLCKMYGLSIVYPSLLIVLAVIVDIISNVLQERKKNKEYTSVEEIKKKVKEKNKS